MTRRITLIGGTGFLGKQLCRVLAGSGDSVLVTSRNVATHRSAFASFPGIQLWQVDRYDSLTLADLCRRSDVIVNLAHIHKEQHRSRIDLPPARRGDFEEVFIELPRRLIHAASGCGGLHILQISCTGASPLSSSGKHRAQGLGEILMVEASRDSQAQGHFTYLDGPKFVWGDRLHTTVLRLPALSSSNLARLAGVVVDRLTPRSEEVGRILEASPEGRVSLVYPRTSAQPVAAHA